MRRHLAGWLAAVLIPLLASPLGAGSTGSNTATAGVTRLFTLQGAASMSDEGDALMVNGSSYFYWVEVPPGLASWRLGLFDADIGAGGVGDPSGGRDQFRTNPGTNWDTTCTYTLTSPSGGVTILLTAGPGTNACPSGGGLDNAWCPFTAPSAAAGHWRLDVRCPSGNDNNAFGLRAHDGTPGSGGTELAVYYDSHTNYGRNRGNPIRSYTHYPWVTRNCSLSSNDFDADDDGALGGLGADYRYTSRTGAFSQAVFGSLDDVWASRAISGFVSADRAVDYGLWTLDVDARLRAPGDNRNYVTFSMTDGDPPLPGPGSASFSQPDANGFRVYLSTDAIDDPGGVPTAPAKPYLTQLVSHPGPGPNPPVASSTTTFSVTVTFHNPTARPVSFAAPARVVRSLVPASGMVTYQGIVAVVPATATIVSQPAIGGSGFVVWDPGAVAAGGTASITYNVAVTPSTSPQGIAVTGSPGATFMGTEAGTMAIYLDETSNLSQARATYGFGPLCELSVSTEQATYALLAGLEATAVEGGVVVAWETAAEVATAGFELYRLAGEEPVRLHGGLLASPVHAPQGAHYRFLDAGAAAGERLVYLLVEHDLRGQRRSFGPYEVAASAAPADAAPSPAGGFEATPRPAPEVRREAPVVARASISARGAGNEVAFDVRVREPGLYRLDYGELLAQAGADARRWGPAARRGLSLEHHGREVAWAPAAEGRGLLFYAQGIDSPYTDEDVYRLRLGQGRRMAVEEAAPSGAADPAASFLAVERYEVDVFPATAIAPDPESDYWYWKVLVSGSGNAVQSFPLEVHDPAPAGGEARLAVELRSATTRELDGEHEVEVRLGGVLLGATSWRGAVDHRAELSFDSTLLAPGLNTLELRSVSVPGAGQSIAYVEGFDLTYPRLYRAVAGSLLLRPEAQGPVSVGGFTTSEIEVYRITDPEAPARLEGTVVEADGAGWRLRFEAASAAETYLAVTPEAVLAPAGAAPVAALPDLGAGADYLVIAPAELLAAAEQLAAYRESVGHVARAVSLEAIQAAYRHGLSDPNAVRDFLAEALGWPLPVRYAVLVGEGSYDYRDLFGSGGNLMPPLMVQTPNGLFSSDLRFADLVGDDGLPELRVGRISARTGADLEAYLQKVIAYEAGLAAPEDRLLLLADDGDEGGDFDTASQALAALVDARPVEQLGLQGRSVGEVRDELFAALRAGSSVLAYSGHGGVDRLASEALLGLGDVPALADLETPPVLTALTCTIGRFEIPGFPSLAEELVAGPGGAIAVWAPSGLSYNRRAFFLGDRFLRAVYQNGERVLGEAILLALHQTANLQPEPTAVYNLFGDPALRLRIPPATPEPVASSGGEG